MAAARALEREERNLAVSQVGERCVLARERAVNLARNRAGAIDVDEDEMRAELETMRDLDRVGVEQALALFRRRRAHLVECGSIDP